MSADLTRQESHKEADQSLQKMMIVPKQPMKIVDLIDDCLVKVFEHLDSQCLFNVAIANTRLRPLAAYIYKRKYGEHLVCPYVHSTPICPDGLAFSSLEEDSNVIEVYGLKTSLLFLRLFGKFIRDLTVDSGSSNEIVDERLHNYISTYCADTLNRFSFIVMPDNTTKLFAKPFANVKILDMQYAVFGEEFASFPHLFPNVRHLDLRVSVLDDRLSGVHFQHLDRLAFVVGEDYFGLSEKGAIHLLNANRQLQNVGITTGSRFFSVDSIDSILKMIEDNLMISRLNVHTNFRNALVEPFQMQRIVDEHPGLVELNLHGLEFTAKGALWLTHQLASLKKFSFLVENSSVYDEIKEGMDTEWQCSFDDQPFMKVITMKRN